MMRGKILVLYLIVQSNIVTISGMQDNVWQQNLQRSQKNEQLTQENIRDLLTVIQRWENRGEKKPIQSILLEAKSLSGAPYIYFPNENQNDKLATITNDFVITHCDDKDIPLLYKRFVELMGVQLPQDPSAVSPQPGVQTVKDESCCCVKEGCCGCGKNCCCTIS